MNTYRSADGEERVWYEPDEIEQIAEDELRRASMLPTKETPAVDVEGFIERHLKASLDQYADLDRDVLGLTEFEVGKPPAIRINKDLTGSAMDAEWSPPGVKGRWRATLAHEAAHILLHRMLVELNPDQGVMFEAEGSPLMFRCLKRGVTYRSGKGDWREVQANRGMAALLMPKTLFLKEARREVGTGKDAMEEATRKLATRFEVSKEAASIRLQSLGFRSSESEGELFAV